MTTDWKTNSTLQGKVNRVKEKGCGGREGDERRGQRSRGSDAARARKEIVPGKAEVRHSCRSGEARGLEGRGHASSRQMGQGPFLAQLLAHLAVGGGLLQGLFGEF